jgi:ElaB/YqjD/DUF883 family membrane-anchored ribosome-binding protein
MSEQQGEALATISEAARARSPSLATAIRAEVIETIENRPYQSAAVALAVGFLAGLSIALNRNASPLSRGW